MGFEMNDGGFRSDDGFKLTLEAQREQKLAKTGNLYDG